MNEDGNGMQGIGAWTVIVSIGCLPVTGPMALLGVVAGVALFAMGASVHKRISEQRDEIERLKKRQRSDSQP